MNLFLYQPPGIGEICIPTPHRVLPMHPLLSKSLENVYKEFLKWGSKPKFPPVQTSMCPWSRDSSGWLFPSFYSKVKKHSCLAQCITVRRRKHRRIALHI